MRADILRTGVAAALSAALLSACALPPPRLDAERQWGEAIANLGMFPIYPPSEDVMVGDAFLHSPNSQFFDLVRITAAPREMLVEQFCWQEQDRLVSDAVKDGASGAVNPGIDCDPPRSPRPAAIRQRVAPTTGAITLQHVTRLREAAMPTLAVGRFSEGEIAGAGLLGSVGASLGIGWSAGSAVRVELKDLQSMSLDELRGSRLVEEIATSRYARANRGDARDFRNSLTPLMLARSVLLADYRNGTDNAKLFCAGNFDALDSRGARIVVANRVLYANTISFNFISESVAATRLAVSIADALGGPATPGVPTLPNAPSAPQGSAAGPAAANASTLSLDAQRAAMLARANQILALEPGGPGQAAARLTVGQFGTLALDRTFARPAAVGMGAALHYPLGDAAVPASVTQIEDVIRFCSTTFGGSQAALLQRLQANLAWVEYLDTRRQRPRQAFGVTADTPVRERVQLPPFQPTAASRVRL
jgi:hypothetical protein